jgi:DNA-binding MarR family transcriptional regulator
MRTFTLSNTHVKVLRYVLKGLSEKLIAIELGISKTAVQGHIKRLSKNGYLRREERRVYQSMRGYVLTEKAHEVLSMAIAQNTASQKVAHSETPQNKLSSHLVPEGGNNEVLRMHRIQVKYYLREHLTPKEPGLLIRLTDIPFVERQGFKHHNDILIADFQDLSIILSPRSVIVSGITVSMPIDSPKTTYDMLETALLRKIQPGIEDLELKIMKRYPRFRILRDGRGFLTGEILQNEIAVEHDAIAERVSIQRNNIMIRDKEDLKARVISDKSKGYPELEFVHNRHSVEDAQTYKEFRNNFDSKAEYEDFLNDMVTHKWNYKEEQKARIETQELLQRFIQSSTEIMQDFMKKATEQDMVTVKMIQLLTAKIEEIGGRL